MKFDNKFYLVIILFLNLAILFLLFDRRSLSKNFNNEIIELKNLLLVERATNNKEPEFKYGDKAPSFTLKDIRGDIIDIAGKIVLIVFFSLEFDQEILLKDLRLKFAYLDHLQRKYKDKKIKMVAISKSEKDKTNYFINKYKIELTVVLDTKNTLFNLFKFNSDFGTVLITKQGIINFYDNRIINQESTRKLVEKYVK